MLNLEYSAASRKEGEEFLNLIIFQKPASPLCGKAGERGDKRSDVGVSRLENKERIDLSSLPPQNLNSKLV